MGKRGLRRALWLLIASLLLIACNREPTPSVEFSAIDLDDFPQMLGYGFPTSQLLSEDRPVVGRAPADFALLLETGQGVALSDLKGRPVVINFWATWCGPCREEMPELVALHEENPNVVVLAVNVQEDRATVEEFAETFGMTMPVVLDPEGKVQRAYGVMGMPTTLFIDADGILNSRVDGMLTHQLLQARMAALQ